MRRSAIQQWSRGKHILYIKNTKVLSRKQEYRLIQLSSTLGVYKTTKKKAIEKYTRIRNNHKKNQPMDMD